MIEVLIAVRKALFQALRAELAAAQKEGRPPAPAAAAARKFFSALKGEDTWRGFSIAGTRVVIFSAVLPIQLVRRLDELDPGRIRILGAWGPDGAPAGVTISFDDSGAEIITGTPEWPLARALALRAMKDLEGGGRPTALTQSHRYMGWADRRYDLG